MDIFVDSANITEIQKWYATGIIDGVTTNPSILLSDKVNDVETSIGDIAKLISPKPVCVEVTTNVLEDMVIQAKRFASIASNISIKIPVINEFGEPCFRVINQLEKQGVRVNATVALKFSQVILAAKAGATYVSIFYGRVSDEGGNPHGIIKISADWLSRWNYSTKIVIGSIRGIADIEDAATAGAHVITIPPKYLVKMSDHMYTRATVAQFVRDAKQAES